MMSGMIAIGLTTVLVTVVYFLQVLLQKRRELDELPCPPMKNRVLGHLDIAGECSKLFPPGTHIHHWWPYIQKRYGQSDCFYLDWRPIGPRWFLTSNPELSSQYITTPVSIPKSLPAKHYLDLFLGENNMITIGGHQWKTLRGNYNPGFSAAHLMTLSPYIVDAATSFCDILHEKAKSNELFTLEEYATRLTIDIIGKVVLDTNFDSQKAAHPIVDTFRSRLTLMYDVEGIFQTHRFELRRRFKLWMNGHKLDRLLGEELDRKMALRAVQRQDSTQSFRERKRSVVDLALDMYDREQIQEAEDKPVTNQVVEGTFRQNAIDNIKTFLFAGHDTTASTLSYIFYLLHVRPKVREKLLAELATIFSPKASISTIAEMIKADPYIINQLEYTTAVIKETLRIFPPASTLRYVPSTPEYSTMAWMTLPGSGQKIPLTNCEIWPAVTLMSRNEKFFPDPTHFVPERFLPDQTPYPDAALFTPAGRDAWRPFEKGPRNCIGQELAMIEAKIIVALTARAFEFTPEYNRVKVQDWTPIDTVLEFADGRPGKERLTVEGHVCYQVLKGAGKPRDGMPGRVSVRE